MKITGYTGNNLGENRQYRGMVQYANSSTGNTGNTGNPNVNTNEKEEDADKETPFLQNKQRKRFYKSQKMLEIHHYRTHFSLANPNITRKAPRTLTINEYAKEL